MGLAFIRVAGGPLLRFVQRWGEMNSCSAVFPPYACRVPLIDLHRPSFAVSIVPKAAPAPLLGLADQSTLYWIAMYVAQLLHGGPYIEMKVLFRPETSEASALKYPQLETTVESHPFDFAQGRLRAQNALGWGTRQIHRSFSVSSV